MPVEKKSYTILTASQKGGVGKTMIAINVAAALRLAGYEVLLIDTDVANPSVGPLLGMHNSTGLGYSDILKNKTKIEDTQVVFQPAGFYIIPAGGNGASINPDTDDLNTFYSKIKKLNFDFVVVDTPPGLNMDGALKNFDEALIITTPEETSVYGAERLSQLYSKYHLVHKLVINRVKEDKYELEEERIEKIYGDIAYAMLPEDRVIEQSEIDHVPAYIINRKSLFSLSIDYLCRAYTLKAGEPPDFERRGGIGDVKKFFGFK